MISKIKSLMTSFNIVQPRLGQKASFCEVLRDLTENRKLVYFGEIHSQPAIINMQLAVLQSLKEHVERRQAKVHVYLEHFSINDQSLIDEYISNPAISEEDLERKYHELSEEGHDIEKYFPIFQFAKENLNTITLNGSFIPSLFHGELFRHFAKQLVREGEETAYNTAFESGYLEEKDRMGGSEAHYNYFESLISGRDINSGQSPGENFRRIFPAQVLKDCAMAAMIRRGLESSAQEDKLLVIAGLGHLEHRLGVPERVDQHQIISQEQTAIITVRDMADLPSADHLEGLGKIDQFEFSYPGDYILLYEDPPEAPEAEDVKEEISAAYDKVAHTASIEGDLELAGKVMTRLGYSASMIAVAGSDAYNYQGVGCPHHQANISQGQAVLDLGSGLGVDSFIAASLVGSEGRVTGLDISKKEVEHAANRAKVRDIKNLEFVHGDMEKMPFSDEQYDVVISNGAFCLASDKEAAFREIHRVLKPGGNFSVACTTTKVDLDTDVNWPVCMRVFMPLQAAQPMLEEIGFRNVSVDDSDSKMTFEEEELNVETDSQRYKIHGNSEEFKHLENFDMNSLCARVVLAGIK